MISWFNSWAQGIILAVIIVTILEMIVPEGRNKKYIKIVMGVYITFTIISPIITKVTGNNFELDVSKYEDLFNSNSMQGANEITSINNQSIENLYLNTIKTDIKTELDNEGYESKKINITADINVENEEAKIYKIDIEVTKKQNEKDIKKVNKVEIGNSTDESNVEESTLSSGEVNKLKEVLAGKYEIEKIIRKLSEKNNLDISAKSTISLAKELYKNKYISSNEYESIEELMPILNKAIHSNLNDVDQSQIDWIIQKVIRIIEYLDYRYVTGKDYADWLRI